MVEKQLRCDDEDLGTKKVSERQYAQDIVSKEGWGCTREVKQVKWLKFEIKD